MYGQKMIKSPALQPCFTGNSVKNEGSECSNCTKKWNSGRSRIDRSGMNLRYCYTILVFAVFAITRCTGTECGTNITVQSDASGIISTTLEQSKKACQFIISAPAGSKVQLNFIKLFDTENDGGVTVAVYEGKTANGIPRKSYSSGFGEYPYTYLSKGNEILLLAQGNNLKPTRQWRLQFEYVAVSGCNMVFKQPEGAFDSTTAINEVNHNQSCTYQIIGTPGTRISLIFSQMDLGSDPACVNNSVMVYEGTGPNRTLAATRCGDSTDQFISETNNLYLVFNTKSSLQTRFKIYYVIGDTGCNKNFTDVAGHINSPFYPYNTPYNLGCLYRVSSEEGRYIMLRHQYTMDTNSRKYARIYEGINAESSKFVRYPYNHYDNGKLYYPPYISRGNVITISLRTTNTTHAYAYRFTYVTAAGCNFDFSLSEGYFTSPSYPLNYPNSTTCNYTINKQKGVRQMTLWTDFMALEGSPGCLADSVSAYDGPSTSEFRIFSLCGIKRDMAISSKDQMFLQFKSDNQTSLQGFVAYLYIPNGICQQCCSSGRHQVESDWTRSVAYKLPSGQTSRCDNRITHGWYRFTSKAGGTIPNSCPPANSCGSTMPVWVTGQLPATTDTEVSLQAWGRFRDDCAYDNWQIKARKCFNNGEEFYIYYLERMTLCMAYCAGTEQPCAPGLVSKNGFTPGCRRPFPLISSAPKLSYKVEKINETELLDFKCDFGEFDNHTLAMYTVSWLKGTSSAPFKTVVFSGTVQKEVHATLPELHAHGFRLGDTIFCRVKSWYSDEPAKQSPTQESNHIYAGFVVEPKQQIFTISERDRKPLQLTVRSTIPIVCNSSNCVVNVNIVQVKGGEQAGLSHCRLSFRRSNKTQEKTFNITARQDKVLDGNRVMHVKLAVHYNKTFTPVEWKQHLPIRLVQVVVTDVPYARCRSAGEPWIRTFDGLFEYHGSVGDHVLVENTCRQFSIHVRTYYCFGSYTCNCGVAAREGDDVVIIDACGGGAPRLSFPSSRLVEPNKGTRIKRDNSGRNFVIEFASGSTITFYSAASWGNIYIDIPSNDFGCTRGLCGNYDSYRSNDRIWGWQLAVGTSLFYHQPSKRKCNKQEKTGYCQCTAPDGINEDIVIDCSTDLAIYKDRYQLASSGYREFRFPALEHCKNPPRPSTSGIDLPGDGGQNRDLYDPKNRTGNRPIWPTPTGKRRVDVTIHCNNAIRNSQAGKVCSKIDSFDFQPHITQCISDIQVSDGYTFVSSAVMAMTTACKELISFNLTLWQNDTRPPDGLRDITCPGLCSNQGTCRNGTCVCNPGFVSADCSIDSTKGPNVTSIVNGGLCDIRTQRGCSRVRVIGSDFMDSDSLSCRMSEVVELLGDSFIATGVQHTGNASMISFAEIICQLRPFRVRSFGYSVQIKGDAYTGHRIAVTNDGSKFSEGSLLYRVYDSNCVSCQNGTCQIKNNTCLVNGYCFRTGEIDPNDSCKRCMPSHNKKAFTSVPFPEIPSKPLISAEVAKINDSEFVDFKCRFGQLENNTLAMYNVSWFRSTPAVLMKTDVIIGSAPRDVHASLPELRALGFQLGDTIFCNVTSWYSSLPLCSTTPKESNHFFAGFVVEPKKFEFQISEGDKEHLELKVNATIPIICSTPHCVVIVNVVQEDESGQAVLSGCQLEFWRSNHPQQKKFNVTAKRDKILDGNRVMHIQLTVNRKKKFTPDEWKKHLPIRKVKVLVKDEAYATCSSTGDPHITTFDNMYYHQYLAGDYAMVINTCRMFQVHVRTKRCWNVACNCGIAAKEGDDVIIIDTCNGIPKLSFPSKKLVEPNKRLKVKRDGSGRNFLIEFSSGAKIDFQASGYYVNIYVSIPSNDLKCTKGLCGTFDKDRTNEFIDKSGVSWSTGWNSVPVTFTESWRLSVGTSLFYYKPPAKKCFKSQRYCKCTPPDDHSEDQVINCNSDLTINQDVGCTGYTEYKFPETDHCSQAQTPTRCNTIEMPDVDEPTNYIYDPKPWNVTIPTWPTRLGKAEAFVKSHCNNAIRNSQAGRVCNKIQSFDFQVFIDQCVEDTKISDDYFFVDSAIMAMTTACKEILSTNMTYWEKDVSKNNTMRPPTDLADISCPNLCSGHGTCINATCICSPGFVSVDCSVNATIGPTIKSILRNGSCDIRKRKDCTKVRLSGDNFMDSKNLTCHLSELKLMNGHVIEIGSAVISNASMISFAEIMCQLEAYHIRPTGNVQAYIGYRIKVSNDGLKQSEMSLPYMVYDSRCIECENETCTQKINTCIVNGYCYRKDEHDPNDACKKCMPSKNNAEFVPDTKDKCKPTTRKPTTLKDTRSETTLKPTSEATKIPLSTTDPKKIPTKQPHTKTPPKSKNPKAVTTPKGIKPGKKGASTGMSETDVGVISTSAAIGFLIILFAVTSFFLQRRQPNGKISFDTEENESLELDDKTPFHPLDIKTTDEEQMFPGPPLNLTTFQTGSNRTEIQEDTTVPSDGEVLVTAENNQALDDLSNDCHVDVLKFENEAFVVEENITAEGPENETLDDDSKVPVDSTENDLNPEMIQNPVFASQTSVQSPESKAYDVGHNHPINVLEFPVNENITNVDVNAQEIEVHDNAAQNFSVNSQNNEAFELGEDASVDFSES